MNKKHNIPEYTVTEVNKLVQENFESNFNYVKIRGEISELKSATKGQIYLTIKDENSILSSVVWQSKINALSVKPEIGIEVIAVGKITSWSRYRTTYQLDIDDIEIAGEGALLKLIEDRKKRLASKGLFDQNKKQKIPFLPNKVGIITSPTGAVIHDIINRINDRFPIDIDLWPTAVQGKGAAEMIVQAIEGFNKKNYPEKPEVIIIARGGGSVEDLMTFNEEIIAFAVFQSQIPIVSAIGHETDDSIIDWVSDLRAATPSAAAEKIVPVRKDLISIIAEQSNRLDKVMNKNYNFSFNHFSDLLKFLRDPSFILNNYKQIFQKNIKSLLYSYRFLISNKKSIFQNYISKLNSPSKLLNLKKLKMQNLINTLNLQISYIYKNNISLLINNIRLLKSNSIDSNLKKGYVLLSHKDKIIKKSNQLKDVNKLGIKFFDKKIYIKLK